VLDFGCGAGRVLRHFVNEAQEAEFWGSDIDEPSVEWCRTMLSPPMTFRHNQEVPPVDAPSDHFDLIYAVSVFTHITMHWAGWLLELHRVTAPNGLLVITFMGEGMSQGVAGEPWNAQDVGMNVYEAGQDWQQGGPMVLHSPWWIREHWGRLFAIDRLQPRNLGRGDPAIGQHDHGVVVLRKTANACDFAELERLDPNEPREATALYHDVQHLRAEVAGLRRQLQSTITARAE
jgi:SAM-dependent methyltransferase